MGYLLLICFFSLIVGLPAAVAIMSIQQDPLVSQPGQINLADFERAKALVKRYDPRHMAPARLTTVQASSDELNTLLKGAFSGFEKFATRIEVAPFGVIAAVTAELQIPENPVGRYVNIRTVIAPSQNGFEISRFAVGSMEISPALIKPVILFGLNRLIGDGMGQPILDSIRSVHVAGAAVTVAFQPPPGLVEDLTAAAKRHVSISDAKIVRHYYDKIEYVMSTIPRSRRTSLIEVMRPVFQLAQRRSRKLDPVRENEAALLAIAIYFGDARFEQFVGEVRSEKAKSRRRPVGHIRLDGRHDFVQHFTISIGLTLTGGDLAANIIGELKEAEDSLKSSGFSFTDLGADRAGVTFAKRAVSGESTALRIQRILADSQNEDVFFPRFTDLPEGMSSAAFHRRFGDINSQEYKRMVVEIDRRILSRRIFR